MICMVKNTQVWVVNSIGFPAKSDPPLNLTASLDLPERMHLLENLELMGKNLGPFLFGYPLRPINPMNKRVRTDMGRLHNSMEQTDTGVSATSLTTIFLP